MAPCHIDGRILSVSGKRVGQIAVACQRMEPLLNTHTIFEIEGIEGLFETCLGLETTYSLTGQDRVEVLWRTMMTDHDWVVGNTCKYPKSADFSPAFGAFVTFDSSAALEDSKEGEERERYIEMLRSREENFQSSCVELPSASDIIEFTDLLKDEQNSRFHTVVNLSNEFCIRFRQVVGGRRLFTTSKKWLGLGPECLEPNDEVWLLKNAVVPFILRPQGYSQYSLVGEAYVHGIMNGELMDAPGGREGFRDIQIV
jgi:hypothetical protein